MSMHVRRFPGGAAERAGTGARTGSGGRPSRGVPRRYRERERGDRDYRMVPVALCSWGACLAASAAGMKAGVVFSVIAIPVVMGAMAFVSRLATGAPVRHLPALACALAAAVSVMMVSVGFSQFRARADPVNRFVASGAGVATFGVRVTSPLQASVRRGSTCSASAEVLWVAARGVAQPSHAQVRLWTDRTACAMQQGGEYWVRGAAKQAAFGDDVAWIEATGPPSQGSPSLEGTGWGQMREPGVWQRLVCRAQDSFIGVTARLSAQGQVLVPGLTLGVMGQDTSINALADESMLSSTYAHALTDSFRNAGIMHLMAVSGGHFVLLAGGVGWLLRRRLAPRRVTACAILATNWLLTQIMYPSDSVIRAAAMGSLGAVCLSLGRRTQAMSALCWTVMLCLVVRPGLSQSYGFALSTLSVAGIVVLAPVVEAALGRLMPRIVAAPFAVTVAAQAFSLPVQVMLGNGVPVLSPLSNVMVAPLVELGTLCGLAALAVSWASPTAGYAFAWLAAACTSLMERCARWFGSASSVCAWPAGWRGAALAVMCDILLVAGVVLVHDLVSVLAGRGGIVAGASDGDRPRVIGAVTMAAWRMAAWWRETIRIVFHDPRPPVRARTPRQAHGAGRTHGAGQAHGAGRAHGIEREGGP